MSSRSSQRPSLTSAAGRPRRRPCVQADFAARIAEAHDVALAQSKLHHVPGMHERARAALAGQRGHSSVEGRMRKFRAGEVSVKGWRASASLCHAHGWAVKASRATAVRPSWSYGTLPSRPEMKLAVGGRKTMKEMCGSNEVGSRASARLRARACLVPRCAMLLIISHGLMSPAMLAPQPASERANYLTIPSGILGRIDRFGANWKNRRALAVTRRCP